MDTLKSKPLRHHSLGYASHPCFRRHRHLLDFLCCPSLLPLAVGIRAEETSPALLESLQAERDTQRREVWEAEKEIKIGDRKVESRAEEMRRRFDVDVEGPNHRVVDVVNLTTNHVGQVVASTNKIVQLADGLNYWDGSKWAESQPEFELQEGYASASKTRHKVNIGGNLNGPTWIPPTITPPMGAVDPA